MATNTMMEEVWRWKEEAAQEIEGMNAEERIAHIRQALQRFEEKTGKKMQLRRLERHEIKNQHK